MYNEHRNHIDKTIRNVFKTINNSQNKMDNVDEANMYQMPHYQRSIFFYKTENFTIVNANQLNYYSHDIDKQNPFHRLTSAITS